MLPTPSVARCCVKKYRMAQMCWSEVLQNAPIPLRYFLIARTPGKKSHDMIQGIFVNKQNLFSFQQLGFGHLIEKTITSVKLTWAKRCEKSSDNSQNWRILSKTHHFAKSGPVILGTWCSIPTLVWTSQGHPCRQFWRKTLMSSLLYDMIECYKDCIQNPRYRCLLKILKMYVLRKNTTDWVCKGWPSGFNSKK